MTYESGIAQMLQEHSSKQGTYTSVTPLLEALGCRVLDDDQLAWGGRPGTDRAPGREALVSDALLQILRVHAKNGSSCVTYDGFGIIDGMALNDRWRRCTQNIDDAYCLAAVLINLTIDNSDMEIMRESAAEVMLTVINGWLRPFSVGEFTSVPTAWGLMAAMFGEAWATLVMDNWVEFDGAEWNVGGFALRERPLFRDGLLPRHILCLPEIPAVPLPGLEAAP
jgi:hypothetical protein